MARALVVTQRQLSGDRIALDVAWVLLSVFRWVLILFVAFMFIKGLIVINDAQYTYGGIDPETGLSL